jgi:hypothetical protein
MCILSPSIEKIHEDGEDVGLEVRTEEAQGAGVAGLLGVEFLQEIK